MQVAAAVFIGNICTLAVYSAFKDFSRPDQDNISWTSILSFLLILGILLMILISQKMSM